MEILIQELIKALVLEQGFLVEVINFLFVFIISHVPTTLGSYASQFYRIINSNSQEKIDKRKIFISSTTGSIFMCAIVSLNLAWMTVGVQFFIAFMLGMLGYELFGKLTTIRGVVELITQFQQFRRGYLDNKNIEKDIEGKDIDNQIKRKDLSSSNENKDKKGGA